MYLKRLTITVACKCMFTLAFHSCCGNLILSPAHKSHLFRLRTPLPSAARHLIRPLQGMPPRRFYYLHQNQLTHLLLLAVCSVGSLFRSLLDGNKIEWLCCYEYSQIYMEKYIQGDCHPTAPAGWWNGITIKRNIIIMTIITSNMINYYYDVLLKGKKQTVP